MNEFPHKISGRGICPRTRRMLRRRILRLHSHHHRFGTAVPQSRRAPGAAGAASGFAPYMSCTGRWPT